MNKIVLEDLKKMFDDKNISWDNFKNKSVLITGAYGMLASYMVWMLIYLNEFKNYDIKIYALGRNLDNFRNRFGKFCKKDYFNIINQDINKDLGCFSSVNLDYIIHAASKASSQYYGVDPVGVIKPNVLGTINTLELAKEKNVSAYLFFSSGEIYGAITKPFILESDSGYLDPMHFRSCYAESKRLGETLCACYKHQYGINTKVVRPSHTYGPTLDLVNDSRVFSQFISNIVKKENIILKSDGSAIRNFCYISDATRAYFKILLDGEGAYNVSGTPECRISIKDLALFLSKKYNLNVVFEKRKSNNFYIENVHKEHSQLSIDKLLKLGWKCNYNIESGFDRTIKSFLYNR